MSTNTQADMNVVEEPETDAEWMHRLRQRARAGETIVLVRGERYPEQPAWLACFCVELERLGGVMHLAEPRRPVPPIPR